MRIKAEKNPLINFFNKVFKKSFLPGIFKRYFSFNRFSRVFLYCQPCLEHEGEVVALLELEQAAVDQLLGDREGQEGVLLPQQGPKVDVVLGRNAAGDYTVNPIHLKFTG
jgi:hypothetical protein